MLRRADVAQNVRQVAVDFELTAHHRRDRPYLLGDDALPVGEWRVDLEPGVRGRSQVGEPGVTALAVQQVDVDDHRRVQAGNILDDEGEIAFPRAGRFGIFFVRIDLALEIGDPLGAGEWMWHFELYWL